MKSLCCASADVEGQMRKLFYIPHSLLVMLCSVLNGWILPTYLVIVPLQSHGIELSDE